MENPILQKMVGSLRNRLADRLVSVVLYGSAARGDYQKAASDFNLIVVVDDLEPATLELLTPIVSRWTKDKQPFPRFFTPKLISEATDVFPIEFLDIQSHHTILFGSDPFAAVEIRKDHLRLQCERELREKMMRLREGFMEARGKKKALIGLCTSSYSTFVALFRGCLHLLGEAVPAHNEDVVAAFCTRAELDRAPFDTILRLRSGEKSDIDPKALFAHYYRELTKAVERVDRFVIPKKIGN
jgi:predicted nucleotidyltransferase